MVPAGVLVDDFFDNERFREAFETNDLLKTPFGLGRCKAFQL